MTAKIWTAVAGIAALAGVATYVEVQQRQPPAQPAALLPDTSKTAPAASPVTTTAEKPAIEPAKPSEPAKTEAAPAPTPATEAPKAQLQASNTPGAAPAVPAPPTPAAAAQPPAKVVLPTFDIVRVEPSGDTVVAGKGMPGATIELLRDGAPFARAVADVGGQWAIVPPPMPKGAADLTLRATTPDGNVTRSDQSVAVRVPEKTGDEVVVVLSSPTTPSRVLSEAAKPKAETKVAALAPAKQPEPAKPIEAAKPAEPTKPEPVKTDVPKVEAAKPVTPEPASPKVEPPKAPVATSEAPKLAEPVADVAAPIKPPQPAIAPVPKPAPEVKTVAAAVPARAVARVRTVEADEAGRFFVTGTAEPGANIRIYLNDTAVTNVTAAADGSFSMTIEKGMKPGDYSVRVDDVEGVSGKVLTRAEVPFVMEDRNQPAPPLVVAQAEPAKPAAQPAKPIVETAKPATETPKPAAEPAKPVVEAAKPVVEAAKPVVEAPKPVAEAPKPVVEAPKPVVEAAKPVVEAPKPVAEAPKPAVEAPKPVAEAPKPAPEPAKPVVEAAKPAAETPKPAVTTEATTQKPIVVATRDIAPIPASPVTVAPATEPVTAPTSTPAAAVEQPAKPAKPVLTTRDIGSTPVQPQKPGPATVTVAEAATTPDPAQPTKPPSQAVIAEIKTMTIVHGDNLWLLSRKIYGRGIRYTWIYDANTSQIRDPHWIYPGQIFVMPDKKEL